MFGVKPHVIRVPYGWMAWTEVRHLSPTAIRLADWPESTFAGDLGIYGHRVNSLPEIQNDNSNWRYYAPHLR